MAAQSAALHTDTAGKPTSAVYADGGDATSRWLLWARTADGGHATIGAVADTAVTNPASSGSVIALLKGALTELVAILAKLTVGATALTKAEDAAHASGDAGVMSLAVRRDTAAASSDTTGDYEPLQTDAVGRLRTVATRDTSTAAGTTVANTTALAASLVVKASPGILHGVAGYTTTAQFIQVHDATSLPADTAVPELVIPVAADTFFNVPLPAHLCGTGIVICNSTTGPTKTIGGADTWLTAYYD